MARITTRLALLLLATVTSRAIATDTGNPTSTQLRGSSNNDSDSDIDNGTPPAVERILRGGSETTSTAARPNTLFEFCPVERPQANSRCRTPNQICEYSHSFNGCSWDTLECLPSSICSCLEELDRETNVLVSTWACKGMSRQSCGDVAKASGIETPRGLPTGGCNPEAASPTPPPSNDSGNIDDTNVDNNKNCPMLSPGSNSDCDASQNGSQCHYDHIYTGCTWDELQCSWATRCECNAGTWYCLMKAITLCDIATTSTTMFGSAIRNNSIRNGSIIGDGRPSVYENVPEDLPIGRNCDPKEDLPVATKEDGCPVLSPENDTECDVFHFNSGCNYDHVYMGCSWDELQCQWTKSCKCNAGKWMCESLFILDCDTRGDAVPEGLPEGEICDPNEEVPTAETIVKEDNCPELSPLSNPQYPQCEVSRNGSVCHYGHLYTGCTWEELQCSAVTSCTCDAGTWSCMMKTIKPCEMVTTGVFNPNGPTLVTVVPEGLPTLETCDPKKALPTAETIVKEDNCPVLSPVSNSQCDVSHNGLMCHYDHVYTGCTWDDLECNWTTMCECSAGTWYCLMKTITSCEMATTGAFDPDGNRTAITIVPEGLPNGEKCYPNEALPTSTTNMTWPVIIVPPTTDGTGAVEGRLDDECPTSADYGGKCVDTYVDNLVCEYDHMYTGCTWEDLACTAILECTCNQFGDELWACRSFAMMQCESKPEGLPFGQSCSPTPQKTNTTVEEIFADRAVP
uniref:Uncharacterized protein n=1 Tax=Pseudo-nitzschia australis TaxID=44445 RepID=A0A7S4AIY4_9STRA|mmetsp:Transcript_16283/g.35348  ORF Transcript_16283/g.35348 Transcript_16283/m.35348 type:complete len:740 (+) Transcript_16283:205-2424(+)|eukprot:CAMPEP_0168179862 /NCGR_PEP_ID=MMETSP0139_2-20121125/10121_1 /TAXON_ID=44445 /ORGANISM="Pseudo-nitzschia australis, Strain 10249 10 AB" /LENGTH=739 /DNA_ID=CAMNT_0008099823 /DNA_START=146 /DNA_END=2365 /DNA_ORIENTATION=+